MSADQDIQRVIEFWFGPLDDRGMAQPAYSSRWWVSTPEFDQLIDDQFGELNRRALAGDLTHWLVGPEGYLAQIILLDQFSRNLYRGTGEAFGGDERARALAGDAVAQKFHLQLPPPYACFLLMPFIHGEELASQELGAQLFAELGKQLADDHPLQGMVSGMLSSAKDHREIIERFGRFPHRNQALGRTSTPDEIAYLGDGGRRFGQ